MEIRCHSCGRLDSQCEDLHDQRIEPSGMTALTVPNPTGRSLPVRWLILCLIVVASFIAYVLRTNMSVVGKTMITDLGMTEVQLGMVFSAFAAGYAIFQFPAGVFGGRVGSRVAIAAVALVWG
ncbi:MAG: MFS transporter, partial [Deltaproteobacteria bacterium]|nr:MFS transporter [Deltaproteobacteria bacterium]